MYGIEDIDLRSELWQESLSNAVCSCSDSCSVYKAGDMFTSLLERANDKSNFDW